MLWATVIQIKKINAIFANGHIERVKADDLFVEEKKWKIY